MNSSCFLSLCQFNLLQSFSFASLQLGGWPVTQNRTDFNSTLGLLMRDYATFPFFSLRVGPKEPEETAKGENKRYIQASLTQHPGPILALGKINSRKLCHRLEALLYFFSLPID